MRRYDLEFFFIPQIVSLVAEGQMDPQSLLDLDFWKRFMENNDMTIDFPFEELSVEFQPVDEQRALILYTFPKPIESPEAKYGAVIVNKVEQTFRYFTLEMDDDDKWMICEPTKEKHLNYGYFEGGAELGDFLNQILKI